MKITELRITKFKNVREKDEDGNVVHNQVEYSFLRPVEVIKGAQRFGHYLVDIILIFVLTFMIGVLVALVNPTMASENILLQFLSFLFTPIYYIICEHIWQRTPGKFLTKSIVIDEEGNKPNMMTNIIRNIIRIVPFDGISCLSDRGWHDRWSKTYVVSIEEYKEIRKLLGDEYKVEEMFV